jgi:hypothetical protein
MRPRRLQLAVTVILTGVLTCAVHSIRGVMPNQQESYVTNIVAESIFPPWTSPRLSRFNESCTGGRICDYCPSGTERSSGKGFSLKFFYNTQGSNSDKLSQVRKLTANSSVGEFTMLFAIVVVVSF